MNLLKGGQGRSPEDLTNTAIVVIWLVGWSVAFAIAATIWRIVT